MNKPFNASGIIDKINNPITRVEWIKQEFLPQKTGTVFLLIGKDIKAISSIKPENYGKYIPLL